MRICLVVLLACLSFGTSAAEARAELEQFLAGLKSLSAEFKQQVVNESGKLVETSAGELFVQRPGQFRWNYKHPFPQEIVGSKGYVWVYDSDLEQVSVKPMGQALGNSPALLLTSEDPLDKLFNVKTLGARNGVNWVELKPLSEEAAFESFRVGMVDGKLGLMELRDNFGQTTQLSFGNIARNPQLDTELFTFVAPPGTDVIGEQPKQ